ncbi:hypothetical protein ABH931_006063 [Streptacidiphilus sp. MAP12-33]
MIFLPRQARGRQRPVAGGVDGLGTFPFRPSLASEADGGTAFGNNQARETGWSRLLRLLASLDRHPARPRFGAPANAPALPARTSRIVAL